MVDVGHQNRRNKGHNNNDTTSVVDVVRQKHGQKGHQGFLQQEKWRQEKDKSSAAGAFHVSLLNLKLQMGIVKYVSQHRTCVPASIQTLYSSASAIHQGAKAICSQGKKWLTDHSGMDKHEDPMQHK